MANPAAPAVTASTCTPTSTAATSNPTFYVMIGTGEIWAPYVFLLDQVKGVIRNSKPDTLTLVGDLLVKHQQSFRMVLTTKEKSQRERDYLRLGTTEPVHIRSTQSKEIIPQPFAAESILLSDVFDISEFQAFDLILASEGEEPNYPCWSRGLIAVALYYEGQHNLISILQILYRIIPGITWGSRASTKLLGIVEPFTERLIQDNIVDKILELLPRFEVRKHMDTLDANLALGDWRHRKTVLLHLTGIRVELGEIIFCIAAQGRLPWKSTLRILEYLRHIELGRDMKFYKEHLFLIMSVVYAVDNNLTEENLDKAYALEFKKYIADAQAKKIFLCPELVEFFSLVYHTVVYKLLSHVTIGFGSTITQFPAAGRSFEPSELLGDDELELKTDVFSFLKIEIFWNDQVGVADEEYFMLRFHTLFTDFINYMPLKLKDMKMRSEDAAKTVLFYLEQGIARPSHLPVEFESFLESMGALYTLDKDMNLAKTFFASERDTIALTKFIRSLCYDLPVMFVCNTQVLTGVSKSCPLGVFGLIKQNGHNLSLDHYFDSLGKYLMSFGKMVNSSFTGGATNSFKSDNYERVMLESVKISLSSHELNGIVAYVQLLQAICKEPSIKAYFAETKRNWIKLLLTMAKMRNMPLDVRAELMKTVAAMIPTANLSHETVAALWEIFYSLRLIQPGSGDFKDELEEKETRLETYGLSVGFLRALDNLVKARADAQMTSGFDSYYSWMVRDGEFLMRYVNYVRDTVLVKVLTRSYRNIAEKWESVALCVSIITQLLDSVPILLIQMLSVSRLFNSVLAILIECTKVREKSNGKIPFVDEASLEILQLLNAVVERQEIFFANAATVAKSVVLYGMHELLLMVNVTTARNENLFALLKFIDNFNTSKHQELALQILTRILSDHSETDSQVYMIVTADKNLAMLLDHTFSQCLFSNDSPVHIRRSILKLVRCSVVHESPNLGLFLLGIDKKIEFLPPGAAASRTSFNILHCMVEICHDVPDVFLTFLVLLRDNRIREPLLRYLRTTQFFVKYYRDSFSTSTMDICDMGHFLLCLSMDLKYSTQVGPLAHTLLCNKSSQKFLDVLDRVKLQVDSSALPQLEFFDSEQVSEACMQCEYFDREYKINLVDLKKMDRLFEDQINKLERSTTLRLKGSVTVEAKELLQFARRRNELRRTEALKVVLFESWKECSEIIILNPQTRELGGLDFITSILRLVMDKVNTTEGATERFLRLAAEACLSPCGTLKTFQEDFSESMLNLNLSSICAWACSESSYSVRGILYLSILSLMELMKNQRKHITSRANFSVLVDVLSKDCLNTQGVGKITAMYLVAEIINWSMRNGFSGLIASTWIKQPLLSGDSKRKVYTFPKTVVPTPRKITKPDTAIVSISNLPFPEGGDTGMLGQDMSVIMPNEKPQIVISPANNTLGRKALISRLNSTVPLKTGKGDEAVGKYAGIFRRKSMDVDSTFPGLQRKQGLGGGDAEIGYDESECLTPSTSMVSQSSTVVDYLEANGLVQHLLRSFNEEEDTAVVTYFSSSADSVHIGSLFTFNAKIYLLTRYASSGQKGTSILLDDSVIPRVSDLLLYRAATRLEVWRTNTWELLGSITESSVDDIPSALLMMTMRMVQVDTLFSSVLLLFHSLIGNSPKQTERAVAQIWQFLEINKECFLDLMNCFPQREDRCAPVPEAFNLFTSLLSLVSHEIPEHVKIQKSEIYKRIIRILKQVSRQKGLLDSQFLPVKDFLTFLYHVAKLPNGVIVKDTNLPRLPILFNMTYLDQDENDEQNGIGRDDITVGAIFRIVQLTADRLTTFEGSPEIRTNMQLICEIGLSLTFNYVKLFCKEFYPSFTKTLKKIRKDKGRRKYKTNEDSKLEWVCHLANYVQIIGKAIEAQEESPRKFVSQAILSRLTRLGRTVMNSNNPGLFAHMTK